MSRRSNGQLTSRQGDGNGFRLAALAIILVGSFSAAANGQEGVSSFRKPVLMVETDGHHAPIRSLIWPDTSTLISAGLDKVVKQWQLGETPGLVRSIRPPVWRGPAGIIYAIALSPWEIAPGKQLLAVAGYGVDASRGDFTIYPYPGPAEPIGRVMPPKTEDGLGQRNSILSLAFNPKSKSLATAGISGIVTLWNAETLKPIRELKGHLGEIRALGYLPDGLRLVTIGRDKTLRLWDLNRGAEIGRYQGANTLNALAISPDGMAILAGSERGELFQFDSTDVRAPRFRLPTLPDQGPIESLAFRPDGRQFVSSIVSTKADMAVASDRVIACDIELHDFPGGQSTWRRRLPGTVYATSFRPDGKAFAYSGGSDQALHIQSLENLLNPPLVLKGKGTTIYDVGFTADSRAVGFQRSVTERLPANAEVDGFDLSTQRASRYPAGAFRQAMNEYNGWTIQGSINRYRLEAVQGGVVRWRFDLSPDQERLWWSYTFIPPGPGHPRPTVAVGCESGVVVFDLETGKRTRVFAGHSSPVVSLASSPDGRWLASGSVDQTLLIYPLDGVDVRPGLGLRLGAAKAGPVVIQAVEPHSFAESMGLFPGDIITEILINGKRSTDPGSLLALPKLADELAPQSSQIGIWTRRTVLAGPLLGYRFDLPPVPSTKRNNPVMSLLLDVEREWVLWTPRGYYETSIEGDTRLLGWHINAPFNQPRANDFLPIVTYQAQMRRPKLLQSLWRLGDLDQALALAEDQAVNPAPIATAAFDNQPPRIVFEPIDPQTKPGTAGAPWTVTEPEARVRLTLVPQAASSVLGWEAFVDQKRLTRNETNGPDQTPETKELRFPLPPNRAVRLAVQARNRQGVARMESLDLIYIPPPPPVAPEPKPVPKEEPKPPRTPQLEVIAVGVPRTKAATIPEIPFADADSRDLAPFFARHLFPSPAKTPIREVAEPLVLLNQGKATTSELREDLDQLLGRAKDKQLLPGDSIAILLVAQAVETDDGLMLALADTDGKKTLAPLIAGSELSETLGSLVADYGCRVALFVDLLHGDPSEANGTGEKFKTWIRDLQQNRQVITFIASKDGPSVPVLKGHGHFAQGLLGAFEQLGSSGGIRDRTATYSLRQFQQAVVERVLEESGRRQQAGCFIPRTISQQVRFASPLALPSER